MKAWADRLERVSRQCLRLGIVGVHVVAETGSTQDAAWLASGGMPGWLVVAGRQTGGRGRLGRAWADTGTQGLALTLTLQAGVVSSVQAGVAVCRAVNESLPEGGTSAGLRWPNDIVERVAGSKMGSEGGRKVAGVLIEVRDGVALVGVGVNVLQQESDFDNGLRPRAVSVRQLGGRCGRLELACRVLRQLDVVFGREAVAIVQEAMTLDTIVGTRRRFMHDGREYAGTVVAISPDGTIDLALDDGGGAELPAATTALVPE